MEDKPKPKIMVGQYDVTQHVAAMFDALVGSMDWGSGFLTVEEIESILIVGRLAGFDWPKDLQYDIKGAAVGDVKKPEAGCFVFDPAARNGQRYVAVAREEYEARLAAWNAQVQAYIDHKASETFNEESCEDMGILLLSKVTTPKK